MIARFTPVREEVSRVAPYNAGLTPDEVRTHFGVDHIVKLGSNENPLGPSPLAIDCLVDLASLARLYPDPQGRRLCDVLARGFGVTADRLILGNGSEDLLSVVARTALRPGDAVVTLYPSFPLHEDYATLMGAVVRRVSVRADMSIDVEALLDEIARRPRMVIFSNPMNPVGSWLAPDDLRRVVDALGRETLLVVDEAYAEYAAGEDYASAIGLLESCQAPWIVLRTFSKAYGLAGFRIGFGITSSPDLTDALHKVRTPFNANAVAQRAAEAAVGDADHLRRTVALAISERERVGHALNELGYGVAPSKGNFLFVDVGDNAEDASQRLLRKGVIVKPWKQAGFERFLRVSIGSRDDNDRFLDAIGPASVMRRV